MKITIVKINNLNSTNKNWISKSKFNNYFFVGENPVLDFEIESLIGTNSNKFKYTKIFSKIQYKYVDKYIEFIDSFERERVGSNWWKSRLSGKNPWISKFYLRFCQVKLVEKILAENTKLDNIFIFIEEESVFDTLKVLLNNKSINFREKIFKNRVNAKLYFIGILKRIMSFFKYSAEYLFHKIISINNNNFYENSVYVFTFLDSRCFKEKKFIDPFLGNFINKINLDKNISFIPVLVNTSIKNILTFKRWVKKNNHSFKFLPTLYNPLITIKKLIDDKPFFTNTKIKFLGVSVNYLINKEILEEWSDFSLNNFFVQELSKKINYTLQKKLIIYPFENQIWERLMIRNMSNKFNNKIYGIQNAPAPSLSTRFFVSKSNTYDFPLPDLIFVNGKLSYDIFCKYYEKNILKVSSHFRKINFSPNLDKERIYKKNIFVACSISVNESLELILFVFKSLERKSNFVVNIYPHPLAKFDYSKFLLKLKVNNNFRIGNDYNSDMNNNGFLIFDSSTAGLEGLLNGLTPIFVSHKFSLNVNPSEFDLESTKTVYELDDLPKILECSFKNKINSKNPLKYFNGNKIDIIPETKLLLKKFFDDKKL
jgi:hypothetical protein